jgi:hypothetical protein
VLLKSFNALLLRVNSVSGFNALFFLNSSLVEKAQHLEGWYNLHNLERWGPDIFTYLASYSWFKNKCSYGKWDIPDVAVGYDMRPSSRSRAATSSWQYWTYLHVPFAPLWWQYPHYSKDIFFITWITSKNKKSLLGANRQLANMLNKLYNMDDSSGSTGHIFMCHFVQQNGTMISISFVPNPKSVLLMSTSACC